MAKLKLLQHHAVHQDFNNVKCKTVFTVEAGRSFACCWWRYFFVMLVAVKMLQEPRAAVGRLNIL